MAIMFRNDDEDGARLRSVYLGATSDVPLGESPGTIARQRALGGLGWLLPWGLAGVLVAGLLVASGADRISSGPAEGVALEARPVASPSPVVEWPRELPPLRLAHWNIHSGIGLDGVEDLGRIAGVFQSIGTQAPGSASPDAAEGERVSRLPHLIGLNEVRAQSEDDQAAVLAQSLGIASLFAPAERQWGRDHFGNGVLGRVAVSRWQRIPLVTTKGKGYRNVVRLRFRWGPGLVSVLVTHIDRNVDREEQLATVFDLFSSLEPPVILMGDFNTSRSDPMLAAVLADGETRDLVGPHLKNDPVRRIDWILGRGVTSVDGGLIDSVASDHPLVWTDLRIDKGAGDSDSPPRHEGTK
jgi:endonuclease/exonuclease/phosphatase family metal-dependent hydrolase